MQNEKKKRKKGVVIPLVAFDMCSKSSCPHSSIIFVLAVSLLQFLYEWTVTQTLYLKHDVLSMCWSVDGTRLLTGGIHITLWEVIWKLNLPDLVEGGEEEEEEGEEEKAESEGVGGQEVEGPVEKLEEVWQNDMSNPVVHLKFSPSGNFFASCGKVCCFYCCLFCCCGLSGLYCLAVGLFVKQD